ncbi:protein kinase [Arcobacter cryaerophilus gv. pseudocryaerophilus]
MSDILKKIDEFNNNHYLNVIKISKNKFLSLKDLYYKKELKQEHLSDLVFLDNNGYIQANMTYINDKLDLKKLYEIDILGRGGQGVVYKTKNADVVIKIALNNEQQIKDKKQIKAFNQKIKKLIYKPLPNDINIAKPLALLQNEAGYVMNLLDGMHPFAKLLPQELSKEKAESLEIPSFLGELEQNDKRSAIYITYYLNTGGLRKRLYALSRLAVVLYRLHSRGIVYFDVSHNNIFINSDDIPLVYLIDADNIEYESINKSTVYTPNFEVPEILRGEPNSTYSDIYAFGILSYLTLTTTHPFDGVGLTEGEWDSDETNSKERWELPWIEDSNDDSNRSKNGLKGTLTITQELYKLFHQLFESGKEDKYARPTLPIWIEFLEKAASSTIVCKGCAMSYYDDLFANCPYCEMAKPKKLIVESYYYKDDKKQQSRWKFVKEIYEDTKVVELPNYIFKAFNILEMNETFLEVKFANISRVELLFNKKDEKIYFESKTPMNLSRKSVGVDKLKKGLSIFTHSDIATLVEIKIEP